MMIHELIEAKRGCGFRKPGGLYLVSTGMALPCLKFPIATEICPSCGGGIKPTRGWTWIDLMTIAGENLCQLPHCKTCPAGGLKVRRCGLLWIGHGFYKTPLDFLDEVQRMGVSRRISAIPIGFEVGKTWVCVAHRKIENPDGSYTPGIFHAFKPTAIEYVVKDDDDDEKLERMEKRGVRLVRVTKKGQQEAFA